MEGKEIISEEIKFVIDSLKKSEDVSLSIFYLSALHIMIKRVFNIDFNKHLVFLYVVLENSFRIIANENEIAKSQKRPIVGIDKKFFSKLITLLEQLVNTIKEDKLTYDILEKITLLTYSITGNGIYLGKKGFELVDI